MTTDVRWGFLGAGAMARTIAPCVHAAGGARLQAVAARDVERARRLGPHGAAYDSYDAVLADDSVDAVYVALANDAHAPWVLRAVEAGKHVLCEKPIGLDVAEVRAMAEAAAAHDRLVVEASWYRWAPRTVRAEALVRAGALGEVRRASSAFTGGGGDESNYRFDPHRGGGALYDVGCYSVSAVLWAAGWAPLTWTEASLERTDEGVDVRGRAQLTLGGVQAEVRFGMRDEPAQTVLVEGDEARLEFVGDAFVSRFEVAELAVGDTVERFAPCDPYQLMFEAVSRRIGGDQTARVVGLDESLRVAEAIDAVFAADPHPAGAGPDRPERLPS
ncbi:putative dehydrogenase [Motilibacter peucedani]|uniref:Putative dehydrogenase n=1 Tax=Motilibacter peucedani TaxID=598650 RepID=A0A420XLB8_9ACTN|nr:Gfo/Idh/MocA family oxidoreductase [Motilibacter peucedani]RKS69326.1 putative dehydrogenase [Motilibacter peucedani]